MNFYLLERQLLQAQSLALWKIVQARTLSEAMQSVRDDVVFGDVVRCTLLSVTLTAKRTMTPSGWIEVVS